MKEVNPSLDRKMTKLSSLLISDNIFAKTRSRSDDDGYRVFPPKWRWITLARYLVSRKSCSHSHQMQMSLSDKCSHDTRTSCWYANDVKHGARKSKRSTLNWHANFLYSYCLFQAFRQCSVARSQSSTPPCFSCSYLFAPSSQSQRLQQAFFFGGLTASFCVSAMRSVFS